MAIGGGTGLSTLLRGLKEHTSNLTAIVTVADDGGSSGVLREELGHPAGRRHPQLHRRARRRRAAHERAPPVPLPGDRRRDRRPRARRHAFGNLLIAAMTAVEGGDFEDGVRLMNRILAVRGRVLPVSPTPLTLHARLATGRVVDGQSQIMRTPGIERVWITPRRTSEPSEDALAAIADAELIVLGPGSLYTSLLPSLLIPAIRDAVLAAAAPRIFVCNVATQEGETTGYDLAAHVEALVAHTSPDLVDVVLANNHLVDAQPRAETGGRRRRRRRPSRPPALAAADAPVPRLILDDVVDAENAHHHDPARLAARGHPRARAARSASGAGRRPDDRRGPPDVTPLRARPRRPRCGDELAAIDPSRPCDRRRRGRRPRPGADRSGGRRSARLAHRLRRLAAARRAAAAPFDWAIGRGPLPRARGCAAGSWRAAR